MTLLPPTIQLTRQNNGKGPWRPSSHDKSYIIRAGRPLPWPTYTRLSG